MQSVLKITVWAMLVVSANVIAQESVTYDRETGHYTVTYPAVSATGEHFYHSITLVPANQFEAKVDQKVKIHRGNDIVYRYKVRNQKNSKQVISGLGLVHADPHPAIFSSTESWRSHTTTTTGTESRTLWLAMGPGETEGIRQGEVEEFSVESRFLPGLGTLVMRGAVPVVVWAGEINPEGALANKIDEINKRDIQVVAIVPMISWTSGMTGNDILQSLIVHLDSLSAGGTLLENTSRQLAPLLQACRDVARQGNRESTKKCLKQAEDRLGDILHDEPHEIRHLLKKVVRINLEMCEKVMSDDKNHHVGGRSE